MMMRFGGGCGDSLHQEDNVYRSFDDKDEKPKCSPRSRYISQFASKVREDANQKKTASWSSMGIPTAEVDPPNRFLKTFSRQPPSHISLAEDFFSGENSPKTQSIPKQLKKSEGSEGGGDRGGRLQQYLMSKIKSSSNSSIDQSYYHQTKSKAAAATTTNTKNVRKPNQQTNNHNPNKPLANSSHYNVRNRQESNRARNCRRAPILVRNRANRKANFRDSDFFLPKISSSHQNQNLDPDDPDFHDMDELSAKLPPVTESTPNLQGSSTPSPNSDKFFNFEQSKLNLPRLVLKENLNNTNNNSDSNNSNNSTSHNNGGGEDSSSKPPVIDSSPLSLGNNKRKPPPEPNVSIKDLLAQVDIKDIMAQKQKDFEEVELKGIGMNRHSNQNQNPNRNNSSIPTQEDKRNTRDSVPHLLSPSLCEGSNVKGSNIHSSVPSLPRLCPPSNRERWGGEQAEAELIARLLAAHSDSNNLNLSSKFLPIDDFSSPWKPTAAAGDSTNFLPPDPKLAQHFCDAFILRKLFELEKRQRQMDENRDEKNSHLEEDENDDNISTDGDNRVSDCYSGKVGYIERGQRDFILENAIKCTRMPAKIPQKKVVDDFHGNGRQIDSRRMVFKQGYGEVPDYIRRRKEEIREEKEEMETAIEKEAQKRCRILTDVERKQIIQSLTRNWEELFLEFQKLPLFSSSHRVIKRKGEIEVQLRDLESDIRLISRHGRLFVSDIAGAQFLWQ